MQYPCPIMPSTIGHVPLTPPELLPYLVSDDSNTNVSSSITINTNTSTSVTDNTIYLQLDIVDLIGKSYGSLQLSSLSKDPNQLIKKFKILSGIITHHH